MRALQRQVADVWLATMETDRRLVPGYSLETEAETVAISVAFASISARVLDRHVFGDEYPRSGKTFRSSKYERFRNVDAQGRVPSGLALIRFKTLSDREIGADLVGSGHRTNDAEKLRD